MEKYKEIKLNKWIENQSNSDLYDTIDLIKENINKRSVEIPSPVYISTSNRFNKVSREEVGEKTWGL